MKNAIFYRIIITVIIVMVALIGAGTIIDLVRPAGAGPIITIGGRERGAPAGTAENRDGMFTGIGRLRIPVSHDPPSTLVVSIDFPYPPDDRLFAEELASRLGDFRAIAEAYFSSLPAQSLINLNEDTAKEEIIRRYNALLRLGRIETLYFTDFMVIE